MHRDRVTRLGALRRFAYRAQPRFRRAHIAIRPNRCNMKFRRAGDPGHHQGDDPNPVRRETRQNPNRFPGVRSQV